MERNRYALFEASPPSGPWHVYVHTPFCPRKCRFCMYYTVRSYSEKTMEATEHAILREVQNYSELNRSSVGPVTSIYLGGGTPSELGVQRISDLLAALRRSFPVDRDAEVTLETFPDTNMASTLEGYSRAGITRISMGVQSLDTSVLDASKRPVAGISQVADVIETCHSLGITANVDLMYGLPTQTRASCMQSLHAIIDTKPDHITHYRCVNGPYSASFRLRNTEVFERMAPQELLEVDTQATDLLQRHGFREYAAGHYAKGPRSITVHEQGEWSGEPLLGLGPAAMSFIGGTLFKNAPSMKSYHRNVDTGRIHDAVELSLADVARRTALLRLTKLLRVDLDEMKAAFGDNARQVCDDVRRVGTLGYANEVSHNVFRINKRNISAAAFELAQFESQEMSHRVLVGV